MINFLLKQAAILLTSKAFYTFVFAQVVEAERVISRSSEKWSFVKSRILAGFPEVHPEHVANLLIEICVFLLSKSQK